MTKEEALDKKAKEHVIYRTFEQWKSGNVLEHGVPRIEHYSEDQLDLVEMGWNYGYDAGRAVEQALDKKAENARELGLDYEPAPVQEPVAMPENWFAGMPEEYRKEAWRVTTPPAAPIPDAMFRHAPEHPQYIEGWNDCRQAMMEMMK